MTVPATAGTMDGVPVMPREVQEWTVDELDLVPDDGLQYELLDGMLLVTPAPIVVHQRVVGRVFVALTNACPDHLEVFVAPLDWRPDERTSLQPDVLVARKDTLGVKNLTAPLVLAVEVLSPSTRRKDRILKRSKYEDCGVENYWIVDPEEPGIEIYCLIDGRYGDPVRVAGTSALTPVQPFPMTIVPAALV